MTMTDALCVWAQKNRLGDARPVFAKCCSSGLALGELEAFAGSWLTCLLALLGAWVAGHVSGCFERGTKLWIKNDEGAGDAELYGSDLAGHSAALAVCDDVVFVRHACCFKRVKESVLQGDRWAVLLEGFAVDHDFAGSWGKGDAGDGCLTTTGGSDGFAHC